MVGKQHRGFAAMDPEKRRDIARKGGKAVSNMRGKWYMSMLGRKGGQHNKPYQDYHSTKPMTLENFTDVSI